MSFTLLWLVAHIKILFLKVIQSLIMNWDLRRFHIELLLFHCMVQVMMIVILLWIKTHWYRGHVKLNPGLKPSCIPFGEKFLFVETELLLLDPIEVI